MKLISIASCCLIASFASMSWAETVTLKVGELFTHTRSRLYGAGWRSDPEAHAAVGEYLGMDRRLIERGFDEVDYCSVGKTYCVLQYTRGKSCLRLQTQGEQIEAMNIVSWSAECRERTSEEPLAVLPAEVRFLLQRRDDCDKFGDCEGLEANLRKLKKKYARNSGAMKALHLKAEGTTAVHR
jgi:hypothetical protein